MNFGYKTSYKTIDRGFIEMIGPFGLSKTVLKKSQLLSTLQTGSVYDYALWMFLALTVILVGFDVWESILFSLDPSLFFIFCITILLSVTKKGN